MDDVLTYLSDLYTHDVDLKTLDKSSYLRGVFAKNTKLQGISRLSSCGAASLKYKDYDISGC